MGVPPPHFLQDKKTAGRTFGSLVVRPLMVGSPFRGHCAICD